MIRKIVQLTVAPNPDAATIVVALCDDGTAWACEIWPRSAPTTWQPIAMPAA